LLRYTASRPSYYRPVPPRLFQRRAHRPIAWVHRFAAFLLPAGPPA